MVDEKQFWQAFVDTAPQRLPEMTPEALDAFHRYFVDIHPNFPGKYHESSRLATEGRIALLRGEMDRRSMNRCYEETLAQGRQTLDSSNKTLCWTKVAAWAAIVGVVIGASALVYQIASSKNPRVPTAIPSPVSSQHTAQTILPSPTPTVEESPSAMPQESTTPLALSTPK